MAITASKTEKSATTALFLCMFLGFLGIHRFYVGKPITGILMILTFGGLGLWTLRDLIYIASGHFKDKNGNELEFRKTKTSPAKLTVIIFALFFLAIVTYVTLIFSVLMFVTREPVAVVENQLIAIRSGDIEKAYAYNSSALQKTISLEEFKKFIVVTSLQNHENISIASRDISLGGSRIRVEIKIKDREPILVEYILSKEGDTWKIDYIQTFKKTPKASKELPAATHNR